MRNIKDVSLLIILNICREKSDNWSLVEVISQILLGEHCLYFSLYVVIYICLWTAHFGELYCWLTARRSQMSGHSPCVFTVRTLALFLLL